MSPPSNVIRIKPYHYIHVLNNNSNVTSVVVGPQTFTRQEHQTVVEGPTEMIMVPPRHCCYVLNPVIRDAEGHVQLDENGQARLRHGDSELRFEQPPFPLYPGEELEKKIAPLQVIQADTALRLRCIRPFDDKVPGDEWLFHGPGTYRPRIEVQVVSLVNATIIHPNEALRLRAQRDTTDVHGQKRVTGEEWLVRDVGSYVPSVDEEIVGLVKAITLTDKKALHLRSGRTFTDVLGQERKAGAEWLITLADTESHIPDVYETVVTEVPITTLSNRQYCIILDPMIEGKHHVGKMILRKGEASFFLLPGERLQRGIQNVHVLSEEEALLLCAREAFVDGEVTRRPGERWMLVGPTDYVPPVEVEIVEKRKTIPLDDNEGIYVRNIRTGEVRAVVGESYLLKPFEELWAKSLPVEVEELIGKSGSRDQNEDFSAGARDPTRVVTLRVPHNSAVQVYDYKRKAARVIFGPELVMLQPDEEFTQLSLSGGIPKQADKIKSLCLLLGPDFMTDMNVVETSDHARLSLKMAYNWNFEVDQQDPAQVTKLFSVPDFVGDLCKALGSRVRAAVAAVSFDAFHKNSAGIIRRAVFGTEDGPMRLFFPNNLLCVTNIDIQSVEPVDQKTRDALQKSVQLAIEITTKSQEAAARHEALRADQEAKGMLERQKLIDEAEAEKARKALLTLQAESAAVEATGQANAEARARAEAATIEGSAAVASSKLAAQADTIRLQADLDSLVHRQQQEVEHLKRLNSLEIARAKELAAIESGKFAQIVDAIGADTIAAIAQAGPEMQAKLLKGLGLQSFMITDGNSPINLFNTAQGIVGGGAAPSQ